MKKLGLVILVLAVVAAVAGTLVFRRLHRPAPSGAALLPDNTLLFVRIPDLPQSRARLAASPAQAIWDLPEVQEFLAGPRQAWQEGLGQLGRQLNGNLGTEVFDALNGEVFLAVTRFNFLGGFKAGLVFGADVRSDKIKAQFGLGQMENYLNQLTPDQPVEEKRYLGVTYRTWQPPGQGLVCYGFLNTMLVVTTGEDTMRDVITRFTGDLDDTTPSLSVHPAFNEFVDRMPAEHELLAFVNMNPINSMLAPFMLMSPQAGGSLQKLSSIRSTGLTVTFDETAVRDVRLTLYHPDRHQPDLPTERRTLRFTSPDTLLYSVGSSAPADSYDQLMQALGQAANPETAASVQQFQSLVSTAGVDVQTDFLEKLGPETAWTLGWREGASLPSLGIVTTLRDSAAARPAIDAVFDALKTTLLGPDDPTPWDERTYQGQTLRTLRFGSSKIAPTYSTSDEFFVLALTADGAQEMVSQALTTETSLADNPQYQSTIANLPPQGSAYMFCDLQRIYPHLVGLVQSARQNPVTAGWVLFNDPPPASVLAPHLAPLSSAKVSTAEHTVVTTYSPFGSPIAVGLWAAGGYAISGGLIPLAPPVSPPAAARPSSNTAVPTAPAGNQTVGSQTPATQ